MAGVATAISVLLIIVAIAFGLMIGPLASGIVITFLGWRHVAAALEDPSTARTTPILPSAG